MAEYLHISADIVRFYTIQIKKKRNVKNRKDICFYRKNACENARRHQLF